MKFTLTTCTSIIDPNLVWGDFTNFYVIISFSEALQSHALFKYPELTNFLKSWDSYKRLNVIPFVGFD